MYINVYFILFFNLKPYIGAFEGPTSYPEIRKIKIELQFNSTLPKAITSLLYLEYDISVLVEFRATSLPIFKRDGHYADSV